MDKCSEEFEKNIRKVHKQYGGVMLDKNSNGTYMDGKMIVLFGDWRTAWNASHDRCVDSISGISIVINGQMGNHLGGRSQMQNECLEIIQNDKVKI